MNKAAAASEKPRRTFQGIQFWDGTWEFESDRVVADEFDKAWEAFVADQRAKGFAWAQ